MPSDCQCSTACETKVVTKIISNKEADRRLKRLKKEVEKLTEENWILRSKLKKATTNKKKLIQNLKNHLDKA